MSGRLQALVGVLETEAGALVSRCPPADTLAGTTLAARGCTAQWAVGEWWLTRSQAQG